MKKGFYSTLYISAFTFLCNISAQSQELAKPIENKAVKKAEEKNNSNAVTSPDTPTVTKNGTIIQPKTQNQNTNVSDATKDPEDYQAKKMDYIRNNPEEYKKYSGNPKLTILTEAELNALPIEEQVRILADEINYLIIR